MRMGEIGVAGDSYSLDEVSALLAVPVSELVRRIEEGAFPGRFLTADWEMRIPVRDVRKAVESMRRRGGSDRSMVVSRPEGEPSSAMVDPSSLRATLEAWWDERESRLVAELQEVLRREDERWSAIESVLVEVRDRLSRLEEGARASTAWSEVGEGWASEVEEAQGPMESVFAELRDLERLLGLGDGETSSDGSP